MTKDGQWEKARFESALDNLNKEIDCVEKNRIKVFQTLESTNSFLLEKIERGEKNHKEAVLALEQTGGKGRLGRHFVSPKGSGIYFSYVWIPENGVKTPADFTVSAAVAVCRAIESVYQKKCMIKWVNDIYVDNHKVCGILAEGFVNPIKGNVEGLVVGIGVNIVFDSLSNPDLCLAGGVLGQEKADSFFKNGFDLKNEEFFAQLLWENYKILEKSENVGAEYRDRSFLTGKMVTVTPLIGDSLNQYKAKVLGINENNSLIVETLSGERRELFTGEVSLHQDF